MADKSDTIRHCWHRSQSPGADWLVGIIEALQRDDELSVHDRVDLASRLDALLDAPGDAKRIFGLSARKGPRLVSPSTGFQRAMPRK